MPLGLGASLTPPAAGRGRRGHRPAARAGAPADGEPRVRPAAARRRTRPRASTASARCGFDRAVERALASGSRSSRWGRDEGRAHHPHRGAARRRVYDVVMDPRRLGDWVTIHHHLEGSPRSPAQEGVAADPVPEAGGQEVQGALAGHRERPLRARRVGGPRAGRLTRRVEYRFDSNDGGTDFSYVNEYDLPGGPLGTRRRTRRVARHPKGSGRFLAAPKTVSRVNG